jgi:2'-5' RNA ligase
MQHPFINEEIKQVAVQQGHQQKINEYLLVAQPHEDLYNNIMQLKQAFAEKYDCPLALYTKPHITLVNFVQWHMQERKVLERLQSLIAGFTPFQIKLDGFGSLPTHSIYLNVQTKNDVVEMVKGLKNLQALLTLSKDSKPHFITEPHLTIARKLLPWQYEKAWLEYSHTPFAASFMVKEILLLRKEVDTKKYYHIATFPLLSKSPALTAQGILF